MAPAVKKPPGNAGDIRDIVSIPRLGRYPGGWHSIPLQYSCLETPRTEKPMGYSPKSRKESDMTGVNAHTLACVPSALK